MRRFSDYLLLGLFRDVTLAGDAVTALHRLGIREDRINVLSAYPHPPGTFGQPRPRESLSLISVIGGAVGFLLGVFMMVGTANLYPLDVGGQPLIPGPPSIVIIFEYTMFGALTFAFVAFLLGLRTPSFWRYVYDPRLTEDALGVLAGVSGEQLGPAEEALKESGAYALRRVDKAGFLFGLRRYLGRLISRGMWVTFLGGALISILLLCVFSYGMIQWIYPDQMVTQQSVGSLEGPRLRAPTAAVPYQGPALIEGQPATEPLPATDASRERGATLFRIHCYMCHGNEGRGDGPLSGYYSPPPADFQGVVVQDLPPSEVFRVISLGRGLMPSLAEGLSVGDRWDIITLIKPTDDSGGR